MGGQYHDDETGLCYTRFRYFDAEAGRWCSPDPLGFAGGVNAHGFDVAPTRGVDVYGLDCSIQRRLAALTMAAFHRLMNIPGALRARLSAEQIARGNEKGAWLKRMFFGSALEAEVAEMVRDDPALADRLQHNTGKGVDFTDRQGGTYDITTDRLGSIQEHQDRVRTKPDLYTEQPVVVSYPSLDDKTINNTWEGM